MLAKILFFATLRERAGARSIELHLADGITVRGLKEKLGAEYPQLSQSMRAVLISINREYAFDDAVIPANAEIAIFPPVSGGAGRGVDREGKPTEPPTLLAITEEEIDLNELLARITSTSTGAAAIFTGMVRGVTARMQAQETAYLEYEAYKPMAEAKMAEVATEIRKRWPSVQGIAIVQRVGRLLPKTPTVMIACTAGHRDTGVFEAARYGIDRLKEVVPVWKKEYGPDGEFWVEGEYIPTPEEH